MVSPSKPSSRLAANHQKPNQSYKSKRSSKPLENYKFYLDIEQNNVLQLVEKHITDLGGAIEFFFGKDVTHFITDKDNNNISSVTAANSPQLPTTPKTPLTPITPLLGSDRHFNASSPSISGINDFKPKQHAPRSRTEAMLQISRLQSAAKSPCPKQTQLKQASPIQAAKTLGIKIWSADYAIKEFESLLKEVTQHHHHHHHNHQHRHTKRSPTTRHLKGDYLKIGALNQHYRPYYQELKRWPQLNLDCKLSYSPFDNAVPVSEAPRKDPAGEGANVKANADETSTRMTRKQNTTTAKNKSTQPTTTNTKQCGYCELCRIEYDVLAVHLKSDEHLKFVNNENNFLTLDNLINSSGANIEEFLKVNSSDLICVEEKTQEPVISEEIIEVKTDKTVEETVIELVKDDLANDCNLAEIIEDDTQMFGRRSAIHQYPHHTLKSLNQIHKHQKHKLTKDSSDKQADNEKEENQSDKSGDDMRNSLHKSKTTTNKSNSDKQQQNRASTKDMGLKNSTAAVKTADSSAFNELDLQDTKRISLGLRQKPKRVNQDTSTIVVEEHNHTYANHANDSDSRRMRRETCKRINYSEPKDDESIMIDEENEQVAAIKVRGIRWRAPSPDNRPPMKSPVVYQVIDRKKDKSPTKTTPKPEKAPAPNAKNGLTLKIKRVRQSELNLLNNEAENFMFPKKDDDSDTDDDRHTSSEGAPEMSIEIVSSEPDKPIATKIKDDHFDSEDDLVLKARRGVRRKRVMTPDPLALDDNNDTKKVKQETSVESDRTKRHNKRLQNFLQDNEEYYKFEDPGSRLRFPEAPIQPEDAEVVTTEPVCSPKAANSKEDGMGVYRWSTFTQKCNEIEPYKFAFERVPHVEPWYEAFNRQDLEEQIVYEYFGNTAYRKLPYELGRLSPLKRNCCILNYNLKGLSSASSCVSAISTSTTCSTSTVATKKPERKTSRRKMRSTDEKKTKTGDDDDKKIALPLKKRALLLECERPRKSPREHASTLAILSSLLQKRAMIMGVSPTKLKLEQPKAEEPELPADEDATGVKEEEIDTVSNHSGGAQSDHEDQEMDKIKFSPPVHKEENFTDYNALVTDMDHFFSTSLMDVDDEHLLGIPHEEEDDLVQMNHCQEEFKRDFVEIIRTSEDEPPLTIRQVNRNELLMRKNILHDRKPRSMLQGGANCFYNPNVHRIYGQGARSRRQNRTGWPNAKRKIVTRKSTGAIKSTEETPRKKAGDEGGEGVEENDEDTPAVADEEEEDFDDLDEGVKTDDATEEDSDEDVDQEELELTPLRRTNTPRGRPPRYVTKTTATMTRVDYNNHGGNEGESAPTTVDSGRPMSRRSRASFLTNDECDSISSRSIFVSDDCDTTSSTLINVNEEQPSTNAASSTATPTKKNNVTKRLNFATAAPMPASPASPKMQPVVCLEKLKMSEMKTRSKSKSPQKRRSTTAATNSPNKKYSPRKLRKPRGRWYKER